MSKALQAATRRVVALAKTSLAYKADAPPFLGLDESAQSRLIWQAAGYLVTVGAASTAATLWREWYLNAEGQPVWPDGADYPQSLERLRRTAGLQRQSCSDRDIVEGIVANLYSHRRVVLVSCDMGLESEGIRWLMKRRVAPELVASAGLGAALVLKQGRTNDATFARWLRTDFPLLAWPAAFVEIVV